MRTRILTLTFILFTSLLFGQNENPYSQFGYEAPIMPEKDRPLLQNRMDRFYLINTDTASSLGMLAIDPAKRNITIFDKKGFLLQVDTLNEYTMVRWLSADPYGQFSSPYVGMGNKPTMGVDPNGGLFGLSTGWSTLAGAGIGFAVGAGAAVLTGHEDDWWKWGLGGAAVGGVIGYATGTPMSQYGSKNARSATGGKVHDNRTYSKFEPLKQNKFNGRLEKEFYLDMGEDDLAGQTVTRRPESFKFNKKFTKTLMFSLRGASDATFGLERDRQLIFSNRERRITPTYKNHGETYTPAITYTYPSDDTEEVTVNAIAPRVKITRKVRGLYLSRIHGSGWKIVKM